MTETMLPVLSAGGSLERYIHSVNSVPMLSADEECSLAERFQNRGDLEAAKKLVLSHLRVVVSVARGYAGYGLPQADLIQEGNIGLMKAVKRFQPNRGVRLFSFAIHWIKAEIHEFVLRNWRLVRIATTKSQRKLFFNIRSMKRKLAALTDGEAQRIADELGVKREEVLEMETRLAGQDMTLSTDQAEDTYYSPIHWLSDSEQEPIRQLERKADDRLQGEELQAALKALDARSRRIIEARWLELNKAGESSTLHDLAKEWGVSAERVRQIEQKALAKMKCFFAQKGLLSTSLN